MTYTDRRQTRGNSSRGKNGASSSCVLHTASAPHVPPSATPPSQYIVTLQASAGLMPTEARGNYFVPISTRPIFIFFVAEVMSNYLTTDGLKKNSLLPEASLWPEARGICHICHMVNPALLQAVA